MGRNVTLEELKGYKAKAALVVARYGEAYLPLFVRLEAEVAKREADKSAMTRALLAAETATHQQGQ